MSKEWIDEHIYVSSAESEMASQNWNTLSMQRCVLPLRGALLPFYIHLCTVGLTQSIHLFFHFPSLTLNIKKMDLVMDLYICTYPQICHAWPNNPVKGGTGLTFIGHNLIWDYTTSIHPLSIPVYPSQSYRELGPLHYQLITARSGLLMYKLTVT